VTRVNLPATLAELAETGLSSAGLVQEADKIHAYTIHQGLAGLDWVDLAAAQPRPESKFSADLTALKSCHLDGLVIGWDLLRIPLERLRLIKNNWLV
jgi:hypothetical protein